MEGWDAFDALYFCIVTLGTVGYGGEGLEPDEVQTKMVCIAYIYIGIFVILSRAGSFIDKIAAGTKVKLDAIAEYEAFQAGAIHGGIVDKDSKKQLYGTAKALPLTSDDVVEPPPYWRFYGVNALIANFFLWAWVCSAAVGFCWTEEWKLSFVDSLFFTWITATTMGYGDAELTTTESRALNCVFILLSASFFTAMVARFASLRTRRDLELRRWEVASQTKRASLLTDDLMLKLQRSAVDNKHDKLSFLVELLVHSDLVQRIECNLLLEYFSLLDADGSGYLDMNELEAERERVKTAAGFHEQEEVVVTKDI